MLLENRALVALLVLGIGVMNALLSAASALFEARKLAVGFAVGSALCALVTPPSKAIRDVEQPDVSTEVRRVDPPRQADTASSLEYDPIVTTGIERATQPGLRRRVSLAHIGIEVEPPSPTASDEDYDEDHTPVPGGSSNHGYSAPPYYPASSNLRYTHFAPPPHQQPGYLTPDRSPLDLAPIGIEVEPIGIDVEPPSPTTSDEDSDEDCAPVPGGSSNHGHPAPPCDVQHTHSAPPPHQQPGCLTPNRSPLDLAPIFSTEPSPPTEPRVIPGHVRAPRSSRVSSLSATPVNGFRSGASATAPAPPHIYATGQFPAGFMSQVFTPRSVPIPCPPSPPDSDEDTDGESTTSSRSNLFNSLNGGGRAFDILGATPKLLGEPGLGGLSPSLVSSPERSLPPEVASLRRSDLYAGTTPILKASSIRNGSDDDDDEDAFDTQTNENTLVNAA
ncbi:hypothetical protein V5O48_013291, partial [Marasmius crinis-equi]